MERKVLVVAYDYPPRWGGVATYASELAQGLQKQSCQVTVLTGLGQDPVASNLMTKRVRLARSGIASVPLLVFHLVQLLRREKFDGIFCCLWLPEAVSVFLALKILKLSTPYFITVHAMEIQESDENLKKRLRQKLRPLKIATFAYARKIFCVSTFTRKLLLELVPLAADKTVVVHNGANPENFDVAPRHNSSPRLFTACRLMPNKGVDKVIQALPQLTQKFPDLQYRVAGEGPDLPRLQELVTKCGMEDHVSFLGKIDSSQLLEEYQQADLFVMLSRQEKHHVEGFGLVFLEAALCGTASLGGRSGGIPDAIEDGITGWLVDPLSDQAILEKLSEILQDRENLVKVGNIARQKTLQFKTWDQRIQQILKESRLC